MSLDLNLMYRQHCTSYTDNTLKIKEEIVVYLCNRLMQHNIGPQHSAAQKGKIIDILLFLEKENSNLGINYEKRYILNRNTNVNINNYLL
jgi:hypothetical protein